jgi:hypothetical protein
MEEGGERRERGESGNGREHVPAAQAYTRRRTTKREKGGGGEEHNEDRANCQRDRAARAGEGAQTRRAAPL